MKFLVVGLGNPGDKYKDTRHNIGFSVVEKLAKEAEATFSVEKHAEVTHIKYKGKILVLVKPTTFMNLSGKAVNYWLQQEKIPVSNLLVITDDLALPFGKLRMKGKGSDGGHNGLKDIQAVLNTQEYARLRFGVGSTFNKGQQVDYVLGTWNEEENKTLEERITAASEFVKAFVSIGLERAMNFHNKK